MVFTVFPFNDWFFQTEAVFQSVNKHQLDKQQQQHLLLLFLC